MQENQTPPQKKKKSRKWIYTIAIIGIVLIGGIFIWEYWHRKNAIRVAEAAAEAWEHTYSNIFSVPQYDDISDLYRRNIYEFMLDNGYLAKDGSYFLTKIADRAKSVYAFGDFTDSKKHDKDIALLFEKMDFKSSMLVIFNDVGQLLYVTRYENDLPVIHSFKAGAKIFMDDIKLEPAPCDGLIIKFSEYRKEALVYDKKTKTFKSYHQYTESELAVMNSYDEPVDDTPEEDLHTNLPSWLFDQHIISKNKIKDSYQIDLRIQPFYLQEDFNGDGAQDIALPVREINSGKVGFVVVHGNTHDIYIIGAGKLIKNAISDDMDYIDIWEISIEKEVTGTEVDENGDLTDTPTVFLKSPSIRIEKSELGGGLIFWNGTEYEYLHQTC